MRYETPTFAVVGNASTLVLGNIPDGLDDEPVSPSSVGDLLLGLDD